MNKGFRYAILKAEVMKMSDEYMLYIWLGLTIIFAIAEAATAQLTTIWFAAGSLAAMILSIVGVKSITVQIITFAAVSLITLIATRPLVKKIIHKKVEPTNADRNIGETGFVTEEICNISGKGTVNIKGVIWTARSADDEQIIPEGELVKVIKIEGVKVIVNKITNQEE